MKKSNKNLKVTNNLHKGPNTNGNRNNEWIPSGTAHMTT